MVRTAPGDYLRPISSMTASWSSASCPTPERCPPPS